MREPSPRSGETDMKSPGCCESCIDLMLNSASKCDCRVPPDIPPLVASTSPASYTSDLEKVMSPKHPLVTAFEMRKLCEPKPRTPKLGETAWSYTAHPPPAAPVDVHPSCALAVPSVKLSKSLLILSASTKPYKNTAMMNTIAITPTLTESVFVIFFEIMLLNGFPPVNSG